MKEPTRDSESPELRQLSHQLNNLLMIIQGNLDLIRMNTTSPEKVASFAELASDALERCAKLTDKLRPPLGTESSD